MKTKIISLLLALVMVLSLLVACGDGDSGDSGSGNDKPPHTHSYGANGKCSCGDLDPNHVHSYGANGKCSCGAEDPNYDPDAPECEHEYVDGVCEKCGEIDPDYDTGDVDIKYEGIYWKLTPILFQLNEASDSGQFTSGVKRYYAGASADSTDLIDVDIRNRNKNAELTAKVEIKYSYLEDIASNDWSRNVETISNNTKNYTPDKSIDVYCNFVYDLGCAAVKGCFASLKANTEESSAKYGTGKNFFRFNDDDYNYKGENYFDSEAGEGYFYEYMLSLTLSDNKVYLLGSDYCTDLVRAFHVVPVHVELMNKIKEDMLPEFEKVKYNPTLSNIEFFYEGVWAGEWTYETLLNFSEAVYQNSPTGDSTADITDTLGFAITTGGLPASGMLYTTSITIIDRKVIALDTEGVQYRIQDRLRDLEAVLPSYFIRINKSTLANEHRIARFNAGVCGGVDAVFLCGYKEYVSRRCFAQIRRRYE